MKKELIEMILESLMAETPRRYSDAEKALKIRNWHHKLHDLTDKQGETGLERALDGNLEFMPSVGTFRELCLLTDGCRSLEDEAVMAWNLAANNRNPYNSPVFQDAAIAETIRQMGGWVKFSSMRIEEEPFRRQDFIAIYQVLKRRSDDYSPLLKGQYGVAGSIGQDYRQLIGFDPDCDERAILAQLEEKESKTKKITDALGDLMQIGGKSEEKKTMASDMSRLP